MTKTKKTAHVVDPMIEHERLVADLVARVGRDPEKMIQAAMESRVKVAEGDRKELSDNLLDGAWLHDRTSWMRDTVTRSALGWLCIRVLKGAAIVQEPPSKSPMVDALAQACQDATDRLVNNEFSPNSTCPMSNATASCVAEANKQFARLARELLRAPKMRSDAAAALVAMGRCVLCGRPLSEGPGLSCQCSKQ